MSKKLPLSLEFFPPKTPEGVVKLAAVRQQLYALAPDFSCIGANAAGVREQLQQFRDAGLRRIVALRGDLPSGYGRSGEFRYASDLVAFIRQETGNHFHIEVAAYPEMHPQAPDMIASWVS